MTGRMSEFNTNCIRQFCTQSYSHKVIGTFVRVYIINNYAVDFFYQKTKYHASTKITFNLSKNLHTQQNKCGLTQPYRNPNACIHETQNKTKHKIQTIINKKRNMVASFIPCFVLRFMDKCLVSAWAGCATFHVLWMLYVVEHGPWIAG